MNCWTGMTIMRRVGLAIAKSFTEAMKGSFRIETDGDLFKAVIEFPLVSDTLGENQE